MSIDSYRRARGVVDESGGGDFIGPRAEELVVKAENALGVRFPPSYRCFLLELGCGGVGWLDVYGVVDGDFEQSSVPDAVWVTLTERRDFGLDWRYVIVEDGGDGTCCALDLGLVDERGEAPVVRLSVDRGASERVAGSFGEYFLERVRSVVS